MTAQVAADLRAAAERIKREGWTQGSYFVGRKCCQAGALMLNLDPRAHRTSELSDADLQRWLAAENALDAFIGDGLIGRAIEWNDAPGRTADEVIDALEAAAAAAEAGTQCQRVELRANPPERRDWCATHNQPFYGCTGATS